MKSHIVFTGPCVLLVLSFVLPGRITAFTGKDQSSSKPQAVDWKLSKDGSKKTNCEECLKDHPQSTQLIAVESSKSPMYVHISKNTAYAPGPVKAGDNGHLLKVDLTAPGKITNVVYDCHGYPCGWVHGCEAAWCSGHNVPIEYHNDNTATWWGWSNSGDNVELVFAIHFEDGH